MIPEEKKCSKCETVKPRAAFSLHRKRRGRKCDGDWAEYLRSECKECAKIEWAKYVSKKENRDKIAATAKINRASDKYKAIKKTWPSHQAEYIRQYYHDHKKSSRISMLKYREGNKYRKAVRARDKKYVEELRDLYIKNALRSCGWKMTDMTPGLIELKRAEIKLHRAIRTPTAR